jgi:hypothetical protein
MLANERPRLVGEHKMQRVGIMQPALICDVEQLNSTISV